jgi:arylamine N-acetyltransferase
MDGRILPPSLVTAVLKRLGVEYTQPDLLTLQSLVTAYSQTVPWESASRIVKKAEARESFDLPRWPVEFWESNLDRGHGGTCFESNYAFFALLSAIGYRGYLTINNMGERIGCHTAIILQIGADKWLADAGYPLYVPLPLDPREATHRSSEFHRYTVRPEGSGVYQIERDNHPESNVFTLIDKPIAEDDYRKATAADYGASGLFLDQVIVNKVIDGRAWRFNSSERPWKLNAFNNGLRTDHPLPDDIAGHLAAHFEMDEATIGAALALTGQST